MDGSDSEQEGFSIFSKKARIKKKEANVDQKSKTVSTKTLNVKDVDDRLSFSDLGLNDWVVKCVNSMQIVNPTPVQVYLFSCF